MADAVSDIPKPKRVLTEAQRLAFLKGREKRMANIEKRRLEKEEAEAATETSKKPRKTPEPATEAPPEIPQLQRETAQDHDIIADRIIAKITPLLEPKEKPKRAYNRRPKPEPVSPPPPQPPLKKFIWM